MPKVELSAETLLLALATLVLLAEGITALTKGRKSLRELSGREEIDLKISDLRQVLTGLRQELSVLQQEMESHRSRLNEGDHHFDRVANDTSQIMDVLDALLMHFISGNDVEKLRAVKAEMDKYKSQR